MPARGAQKHRQAGDVAAVEFDGAAIGVDQADGHPEAGGLTRTVGSEQPDDLALRDLVINAADNLPAAVPLFQASDFQERHGLILLDRGPIRATASASR